VLPDLIGRGRAMELLMTGRWVGAAEALTMGLVSRVEDDPARAAGILAAQLAAGCGGELARAKALTAEGGQLARLRAERQANRSAWAHPAAPGAG
jgi:enoyl-CoA hydratase/carnithine racemase